MQKRLSKRIFLINYINFVSSPNKKYVNYVLKPAKTLSLWKQWSYTLAETTSLKLNSTHYKIKDFTKFTDFVIENKKLERFSSAKIRFKLLSNVIFTDNKLRTYMKCSRRCYFSLIFHKAKWFDWLSIQLIVWAFRWSNVCHKMRHFCWNCNTIRSSII